MAPTPQILGGPCFPAGSLGIELFFGLFCSNYLNICNYVSPSVSTSRGGNLAPLFVSRTLVQVLSLDTSLKHASGHAATYIHAQSYRYIVLCTWSHTCSCISMGMHRHSYVT